MASSGENENLLEELGSFFKLERNCVKSTPLEGVSFPKEKGNEAAVEMTKINDLNQGKKAKLMNEKLSTHIFKCVWKNNQ